MTPTLTSNTVRERGWLSFSSLKMILCRVPPFTSMLDRVWSLESTQYRRWLTTSVQRHAKTKICDCSLNLCALYADWMEVIAIHWVLDALLTEGDAIWPHDVICYQGQAICSIQPTLLNFGLLTPVRPVHKAKEDTDRTFEQWKTNDGRWLNPNFSQVCSTSVTCHSLIHRVNYNGSWFLQVVCDQRLSFAAVCRCHRNSLQNAVRPVDVAMDPIKRNAFWGLDPTANYFSVVRGVAGNINLGAVREEIHLRDTHLSICSSTSITVFLS